MVLRLLLARADDPYNCSCAAHAESNKNKVVFGVLVPILVILSGIFAGLTLGYMSLDETQLNVLSSSGTE
jgi:metal transporter CNNM